MSLFSGTLLLWSSFQIFIVLGQRDISLEAVSSYGIPEEPLITSQTENERQAEEEHGGGGHEEASQTLPLSSTHVHRYKRIVQLKWLPSCPFTLSS